VLLSFAVGKLHWGNGTAVEESESQSGANSDVGEATGADSVEVAVGGGATVGATLAVGTGVAVGGCEDDRLQAAVNPARNKPVKMTDFKILFMPILLDNR
jgi:hypothetical protein